MLARIERIPGLDKPGKQERRATRGSAAAAAAERQAAAGRQHA
jgi:hypothetical protein